MLTTIPMMTVTESNGTTSTVRAFAHPVYGPADRDGDMHDAIIENDTMWDAWDDVQAYRDSLAGRLLRPLYRVSSVGPIDTLPLA